MGVTHHRKLHGVISLLLVVTALAIAAVAIGSESLPWLLVYFVLVVASGVAVVGVFCTKCPARHGACAHLLPGMLTRLLPPRPAAPYRLWENLVVGVALAVIALVPQYWLWQQPWLAVPFWCIQVVAVLEIRRCVCPGCPNERCPLAR